MFTKLTLFSAAALGLSAVCANASTVDLSSLDGTIAVTQTVPELSITAINTGVGETGAFINVTGIPVFGATEVTFGALSQEFLDPVTSAPSGRFSFANDFTIDFATASTGVKLSVADTLPDTPTVFFDEVEISAFDATDTFLGSLTVKSGNSGLGDLFDTTPNSINIFTKELDFSSFGAISKLSFDDKAAAPFETGGFLFYGVEATSVAPVPLPASLPLLVAGAGLFGVLRLRRPKKS